MVRVLRFCAALLAWLRSSQARREAEILYLRQQLIVLRRSAPPRPRLKAIDRLIFVCLYRLFPSLIEASIVFKPETLLRWHRHSFRLFWHLEVAAAGRSPCPTGRHPKSRSTDQSREPAGARRVSMASCSSSASRSLNLSVAKILVRRRGPPSQGWKTFIRNHAPDIAAIDLFVVPTIDFKLLYGLAIIRLERRRGVDQRHRQPNLRMDCSPDHRGLPLGRGTSIVRILFLTMTP